MQLDFATLETSKNGGSATIAQTFVCATPPTERPYVLASWIFTGRHNLEWLNAYIYWLQARLTYDFFRFLKGPLVEKQVLWITQKLEERPLAASGTGRNHPRRGACRFPCPSLRLAGSTPFGDYVPHCLRHRLPLYFHSTEKGHREMAQNRFLMP